MTETPSQPIWAREGVFGLKPSQAPPYGLVYSSERVETYASREELIAQVQAELPAYLWTPEEELIQLPEAFPELLESVKTRRVTQAESDLDRLKSRSLIWVVIFVYQLYSLFQSGFQGAGIQQFLIFLLLLLIFLGFPFYEAWKRFRESKRMTKASMAQLVSTIQFETWLSQQKKPFTQALIVLISVVAVVQLFAQQSGGFFVQLFNFGGIDAASLTKEGGSVPSAREEPWRMFTGSLMHGNVMHLFFNASGLLYLGARVEALARWPHLILVLFVSIYCGAYASMEWTSLPSVGISGGIMGLLGFLLVFESCHPSLTPKPARRRLVAAMIFTFILGAVGFLYIDNAAHFGGLVAGAIYSLVVFPPSRSALRPKATKLDLAFASFAGIFLLWMGVFAVLKILDSM